MENYLTDTFYESISQHRGPKILFIQDEFRWVDQTMAVAERLGISVIFTVVNRDVVRRIYHRPYFSKVRFEHTLTGFVPEGLVHRKVPHYSNRKLDVSYRARKLPGWCGSFALQKWQIGERFLQDAPRFKLRTDIAISEASRLYGEAWINLLSNSRATLGTESGASFVDFSGHVLPAVDAFEAQNPDASFDVVRDRFLEGRDGDIVIHVISPRCFEAASLRTLMILYPGEYSGVLKPGRHYVELAPDHSNMAEIVEIIRDPDRAGETIANAYEEIAKSPHWTFRTFIEHFDRVADDSLRQVARESRRRPGAGKTRSKTAKELADDGLPDLAASAGTRALAEIRRVRAIQEKYVQNLSWISLTSAVIERLPPRLGNFLRYTGRAIMRLFRGPPARRRH